MNILAIETSCDETAMALIKCSGGLRKPQFKILKNIVFSQIAVHRPFHGVVPNLAKREHLKNLPIVLRRVIQPKATTAFGGTPLSKKLKIGGGESQKPKVDCVAVTVGPGLEPALWTGINFAEELAKSAFGGKKPLIGVNHLEGHLYSNWLPQRSVVSGQRKGKNLNAIRSTLNPKMRFPAIALLVSGGHTILLFMKSLTQWIKLGETLDDAAGEAFDKVARMLELPYPGGPEIQKLAEKGNPKAINFPRPMLKTLSSSKGHRYDFSFSGLKTSVLYYLRDHQIADLADKGGLRGQNKNSLRSPQKSAGSASIADVAASFQQAVIDVLVKKTTRAAEEFKAKSIMLCGGVAANKSLREAMKKAAKELKQNFVAPDFEFNTDNAAMAAAAAYISLLNKKHKPLKLEAQGNLSV